MVKSLVKIGSVTAKIELVWVGMEWWVVGWYTKTFLCQLPHRLYLVELQLSWDLAIRIMFIPKDYVGQVFLQSLYERTV